MSDFDATVVGAGPNGLSAALALARSGRKVLVLEAKSTVGGGTRTKELTIPGFLHDVCSAIHPSGIASPFFEDVGLEIDWVQPPIPVSHPLGGDRVAALHRSLDETVDALGADGRLYRRIMGMLSESIPELMSMLLGPVRPVPEHKALMLKSAFVGGFPASVLGRRFRTPEGRALFAGLAAHAMAPFKGLATSGAGLVLGAIGHGPGWPLVAGGSQGIADALVARIVELGGEVETGRRVDSIADLPGDLHFLDVMPPDALRIASARMSPNARRRMRRWRPGSGVFKVDWALDGPIPWTDRLSSQAGTVHVGGTFEEIEASEREVFQGKHPHSPFVLVAQQSLFDPSRAPQGKHTAWGYCHVPLGSSMDLTDTIERQIERFAPGFRDIIIGRASMNSVQYQTYNPNLIGGDIGGGRFGVRKILQVGKRRPYDLGGGVYLCSSATPPGAGVHGMCGYNAVRAALG
jgi:phytoene dehydrogenase-like protein